MSGFLSEEKSLQVAEPRKENPEALPLPENLYKASAKKGKHKECTKMYEKK